MKMPPKRFARQLLIALAYVAFGVKVLIPVGYMPGAISAGSPFQLCDAGLLGAPHAGHNAHHSHGDSQDPDPHELSWKHCPIGALAAAGAIPVEYQLHLPPVEPQSIGVDYACDSIAAPVMGFRARAPPLPTAIV